MISSFFHNSSSSKIFDSPCISKTTGKTRSSTRRQFRTSLVGFLSAEEPALLIKDVAYAVTEVFGGDGNVWSEIKLKRRWHTTCISVATFSGASVSARRTVGV